MKYYTCICAAILENELETIPVEISKIIKRIIQNKNDIEQWRDLLKLDFDINDKLWSSYTLLIMAIQTQNTEIVQMVLNRGASVRLCCIRCKCSVLHFAASEKNKDIVKLLLQKGAEINSFNVELETPLHRATDHGNLEIVQILIANGADITWSSTYNESVLDIAIQRDDIKLVQLLLDYVVDVNSKEDCFFLHKAAETVKKNSEILQLLIDKGANVNAVDWFGDTPLHCAVRENSVNNARILLKNNANPNVFNSNGNTPLINAILGQSVQLVYLLIKHGANISLASDLGEPIHYAVKENSRKIVEILLKNGANVNANSVHGTPLRLAVAANQAENVWLMLNHGADVTLRREIENFDPCKFSFRNSSLSLQIVQMCKLNLIRLHYPELFKRLPKHMLDEIEMMRNDLIIPDYNFSVLDILTENFCRLTARVKVPEIRKVLEERNFTKQYSACAKYIKFRLKKAIEDAELFNRSHDFLRRILNKVTVLPEEVTKQIINYLTCDEMKMILRQGKRKAKKLEDRKE